MSFISELFGRKNPNGAVRPLYEAVIAEGRKPHWYIEGQVPDTLDGRFDMIAAILCVVLIRLEQTEDKKQEFVWLMEQFATDMEGQLRQIGVGDLIVGKHVGRMVGALGGRLGAYRDALLSDEDLAAALVRNLYRGEEPDREALEFTATAFARFHQHVQSLDPDTIVAGQIAKAGS